MQNISSLNGNEGDVILVDLLFAEAEKRGIIIEEHCFKTSKLKGLYVDNVIILNPVAIKDSVEKRCILSEELGHHETTYGIVLDASDVRNRKQEQRAKNWAYDKLIPLHSLVAASKQGIRNKFELAEFLDVTEGFLEEAITHFQRKYGPYAKWASYVINFDPFGVFKT